MPGVFLQPLARPSNATARVNDHLQRADGALPDHVSRGIDAYARGPGGQNAPLAGPARAALADGLREHPNAMVLLAYPGPEDGSEARSLEAIGTAGFKAGDDILLGLDVASSEFYSDGVYNLESEDRTFDAAGFSAFLAELADAYPIITIEDGMDEGDWEGWKLLTEAIGDRVQLVGDDLFVTNTAILGRGIKENIANAILIKPNQIGTLSETLDAITMAVDARYSAVISQRSGETSDATIADIAVGTRATQIKTGSLSRSDRIAKYNQLLRIEEELGGSAGYAGRGAFSVG